MCTNTGVNDCVHRIYSMSQKSFCFCNTEWFHENGHRTAVPFRYVPPRYCAAANNCAGRFMAVLIASSSAKPTRLSAWSSPIVIFTRQQRQANDVNFSDEATVQLESHQKRGGTNGTEQNGLAVVIPLHGQNTETFIL